MNISPIHQLALSVFITATSSLALAPAQAQSQEYAVLAPKLMQRARQLNESRFARARESTRRRPANTEICALDKETGAGMTILKVPAQASAILVKGMPHRFSLVTQEVCADQRDNDCDGQIDENCGSANQDTCGDGIVQPQEECDDGNQINGDGCSDSCILDDGELPVCGDGILQVGEACDDGNRDDSDSCTNKCTLPSSSGPLCGDGIVQAGEECDDGNTVDEDECANDCRIGPGGTGVPPRFAPADRRCDECMDQRCANEAQECLDDPGCWAPRECILQSRCLSPRIASLSCLCGSLSIAACREATSFPGACAGELMQAVGANDGPRLFSEWLGSSTPGAKVNRAFVCMTRHCQEECRQLYDFDAPPPPCGDGRVDANEECDDGNTVSGDGCSAACKIETARCGDGKVSRPKEECDDGNSRNGDGCSASCKIEKPGSDEGYWLGGQRCDLCMESSCASETQACKQNPEGCDPARTCMGTQNCSSRTTGPLSCVCGAGVNPGECVNGSELRGVCALEMVKKGSENDPQLAISQLLAQDNPAMHANRGFVCMGRHCYEECANNFADYAPVLCGNGIPEEGELCDDGNTVNGDGCSAECELEICGNGSVEANEQCDDGNTVAGDGCSSGCQFEGPICGNGIVEGEEDCDDGNLVEGDDCPTDCKLSEPHCGNGLLERFEECDDGNEVAGDGCSPNCLVERCGNGILEQGEECDDGNVQPDDRCSPDCTIYEAVCGNGILEQGEACDDGNVRPDDRCSPDCTITEAVCGNGIVEEGELCDDGNDDPSDACAFCGRGPTCGDGFLQRPYEECDDGNRESDDGCSPECTVEVTRACGDAVLDHDLGEECDDGNRVSGDGCSSSCKSEEPVCGNGIVEKGEECDKGSFDRGSTSICTIDCQVVTVGDAPDPCSFCVETQCSRSLKACKNKEGCMESRRCAIENQCMSRRLGPLSCFCGEGLSVKECVESELNQLDGACTTQMAEGLGATNVDTAISNFLSEKTATGLSNQVLVCMARKCAGFCEESFDE